MNEPFADRRADAVDIVSDDFHGENKTKGQGEITLDFWVEVFQNVYFEEVFLLKEVEGGQFFH